MLGLLPGLIDQYPHTDKAGVLRHQAGTSGKVGTAEMYPAAAKVPFVRGVCRNGVSRARRRVRGACNGMKLSCRTAHSAGRPSQSSRRTVEGPASHNAAFEMKCHLSFLLANECRMMSFRLAGRVFRLAGREFPKIALNLVPGHLQCSSLLQTCF